MHLICNQTTPFGDQAIWCFSFAHIFKVLLKYDQKSKMLSFLEAQQVSWLLKKQISIYCFT